MGVDEGCSMDVDGPCSSTLSMDVENGVDTRIPIAQYVQCEPTWWE